jgi:hypothetical protein
MGSDRDGSERRRAERVPVNSAFSKVPSTTYISDLSEGGVFIHTRRRAPIGTILDLRFTVLLGDPFLLEGRGRVVRHSDDPPGMGILFVDPSPELILRINDVVSRRRPIDTGPPVGGVVDDVEATVHRARRPVDDDMESQKTGLYPSIRIQVHDFDGAEGEFDDDDKTRVSASTMQLEADEVEEILEGRPATGGSSDHTVDLKDSEVEFIRRHSRDDEGEPG